MCVERVKKCAVKLILKNEYQDYEDGLLKLNLQNVTDRRQMLALRFANKCKEHDRFRDWFPMNVNQMKVRNGEKYRVNFASTTRLKNSAIPAMQRLLNQEK